MTANILLAILVILAALVVVTRANASDPSKGTVVSETIVATWRCQDKLPEERTPARSPWKHHSRGYWVRELNLWTLRLRACRATLARRAYEWNWQAWLPDYGARLAVCETSMNWGFVGSSTDGHFVSAFAISVQEYDRDAARMGVRGWWDRPAPPSPWEQWQAARGHYARFGDGWTGHCHGIMR